MIRSINIDNIRGIRTGELADFTPLVILTGPNNSGKSTVLESLFIGANHDPQGATNRMVSRRQMQNGHQWLLRYTGEGAPPQATISVKTDSPKPRLLIFNHSNRDRNQGLSITGPPVRQQPAPGLTITHSGPEGVPEDVKSIDFIDCENTKMPLDEMWSNVTKRGLAQPVQSIIRELVPNLELMQLLGFQNKTVLYQTFKDQVNVPVGIAGDGIRLLVAMAMELATPAGGVVLIEEPETHMHPAAIRQIAKAIWATMSRKVQVFLTTHNLDVIDSLLAEALPNRLNDISVYRCQLKDGELKSYRLAGKEVSFARNQIEGDLR